MRSLAACSSSLLPTEVIAHMFDTIDAASGSLLTCQDTSMRPTGLAPLFGKSGVADIFDRQTKKGDPKQGSPVAI
jgi:hypothetical protein